MSCALAAARYPQLGLASRVLGEPTPERVSGLDMKGTCPQLQAVGLPKPLFFIQENKTMSEEYQIYPIL